jgi:DNA-3-methyladenine glycosylase II
MSRATVAPILILQPQQPYDFNYALTYFTRRAGELVDRAEAGAYRRLFALADGPLLAEVRPSAGGRLSLTLRQPDDEGSSRSGAINEVAATLTRTLGLQDDLTALRATAAVDPPLAALLARYPGLRLISTASPFEAFVWSVIGQQISLHVAFRLKAALVQRFGARAEIGGSAYWAFPTSEALAASDPAEIAALGLGRRKAATLVSTASLIAGGRLDLDALAGLPLPEAEAALVALHGVGPWTAHYTLLRGLRVYDACPVSDMGLRVACGEIYALGRKASAEEVASFAERWRPFRGYAAFYLWYSLSEKGRSGDG